MNLVLLCRLFTKLLPYELGVSLEDAHQGAIMGVEVEHGVHAILSDVVMDETNVGHQSIRSACCACKNGASIFLGTHLNLPHIGNVPSANGHE